MKNSQVGILSAVILLAALIIAGSNWFLVRSIKDNSGAATPQNSVSNTTAPNPSGKKNVIAMMPKAKGDPYFISCKTGAEEAARELGAELLWDGPTDLDPAKLALARELGATHVIDSGKHDLVEEVGRITAGTGVPWVIEAVGRAATLEAALECVAAGGTLVAIGLGSAETRFAVPLNRLVQRQ